jgi:hypothetical protein
MAQILRSSFSRCRGNNAPKHSSLKIWFAHQTHLSAPAVTNVPYWYAFDTQYCAHR